MMIMVIIIRQHSIKAYHVVIVSQWRHLVLYTVITDAWRNPTVSWANNDSSVLKSSENPPNEAMCIKITSRYIASQSRIVGVL